MPGFEYTMISGDSLTSLARRYEVEGGWEEIWNDDANEELRSLRGDPDRLMPGDRVWIPGAEGNTGAAPSGGTAAFETPPPYRIFAEDGTSPPPGVIPRGETVRLRVVHDSYTNGTWLWTTDSIRVTLSDETTDTVTVTAGEEPSVGFFGETIRVAFTPDGGETMRAIGAAINVVRVTFSAHATQGWGFDAMGTNVGDATPHGATPQISVRKNSTTKVMVTVAGGVGGGMLCFTSDDDTTAEAVIDGTPPAVFTMDIQGKSKNKASTLIRARARNETGPIIASLGVNVYSEKEVEAKVAKIYDSTSPDTTLSRPSFSVADTQTVLRGYYKKAVAMATLTDYASDGGAVDINFDTLSLGALVLEAGRVSAQEQVVRNALTGTGNKIVVVRKLLWLFNLGTAASVGDTTITMGSHISANSMAFITNRTYNFGGPGNYEEIEVTACNTTTRVVTLASALTLDHPITEGIWWPLGGLSGNPAWVEEEDNSQAKVNEVIGHELGHELLDLRDVENLECLMHYSNSRTAQEIRYKEQPRHYNPPGGNENQWNEITRPS